MHNIHCMLFTLFSPQSFISLDNIFMALFSYNLMYFYSTARKVFKVVILFINYCLLLVIIINSFWLPSAQNFVSYYAQIM